MGKKSRLKRESVRYSDGAPELPDWVTTPLTGISAVGPQPDGDPGVVPPAADRPIAAIEDMASTPPPPARSVRTAGEVVPEA